MDIGSGLVGHALLFMHIENVDAYLAQFGKGQIWPNMRTASHRVFRLMLCTVALLI